MSRSAVRVGPADPGESTPAAPNERPRPAALLLLDSPRCLLGWLLCGVLALAGCVGDGDGAGGAGDGALDGPSNPPETAPDATPDRGPEPGEDAAGDMAADGAVDPDGAPMDMAPDRGPPDGALPDGARPDMAALDMAALDMAALDMAALDMAALDMAAFDLAPPDLALPDLALPDLALPDLAPEPDAAPPDMAPDLDPACEPIAERCNARDDDCDRRVDEDLDPGAPCTAGRGPCAVDGVEVCLDGRWTCGAQALPGSPDICNGVDDDCDGALDEVPFERCVAGVGACAVEGQLGCADDGGIACDVAPWPGLPEACNDVDDDCDGLLDEGGVCEPGAEDCAVDGDEDGDGRADCDDPACFALLACRPPEDCQRYGDEDGDGDAECDDVACAQTRGCRPDVDIAPPGEDAVFNSGINAWDPVWSRPGFGCQPGPGGDYHFELNRIVNRTGRPQQVDVVVSWQGDGYLFLFDIPFDPARPEDCVLANDDYMGLRGSRLTGIELDVDQERLLIMSTRAPGEAIGRYRTVVTTRAIEQ